MAKEVQEEVQRWTAKRRAALMLSILKRETSVVEAARQHGLTVAEVEDWKERFMLVSTPFGISDPFTRQGRHDHVPDHTVLNAFRHLRSIHTPATARLALL